MDGFARYYTKFYSTLLIFLTIVLSISIGVIDYWTGYRLSFSLFYLVPVLFVTWLSSLYAGIAVSLLCAAIWSIAEVLGRPIPLPYFILIWNASVRLAFFLLVTYLVSRIRSLLDNEKHLARTDYLTKIPNSRRFFELASQEVKRAYRYGRPFTVMYIDIDNFKKINDNYGHKGGDDVLCLVARTIRECMRTTDIVSRIAGDEFVILMVETNYDQAESAILKLQRRLQDSMEQVGWPVTFSIGAVTFLKHPSSVDEMIKTVDSRMYSVKEKGKNAFVHEVYQ